MYESRWEMAGFDALDEASKCLIIHEMVGALVVIDMRELRRLPDLPALYELRDMGKVKYAFQNAQDDWKDAIRVLQTGCGSCNSLAAFRAAELQNEGTDARPYIRTQPGNVQSDGTILDVFHVIVRIFDDEGHPTGEWEDPAAELGMPVPAGANIAPF